MGNSDRKGIKDVYQEMVDEIDQAYDAGLHHCRALIASYGGLDTDRARGEAERWAKGDPLREAVLAEVTYSHSLRIKVRDEAFSQHKENKS